MLKLDNFRRLLVILGDVFLVALSFFLAFFIRFEQRIPLSEMQTFLNWIPWIIAARLFSFYIFDLYRGIRIYASVGDLINILKAIAVSSVAFLLIVVFFRGLVGFPRSVFIIDTLLVTFLISGSRFFLRVYREIFPPRGSVKEKKILIVGAGDAGYSILREIKQNQNLEYDVVGLIDDDKVKRGMDILGTRVLGSRSDIERIAAQHQVEEIIIAIPSATRQQLKPIVDECNKTAAKIKIVPAMGDLINGKVSVSQIREVQIEDLLGREVVDVDRESIRGYLTGKVVLITGAGGSIGGMIARKVLSYKPKMLLLLGRGEHSIYQINNTLLPQKGDAELVQILGDIVNRKKLEGVFRKYKPQIVFHAGADKHVPLMEMHPDEAVMNNIIGTRNVIDVSEEFGVEKVVCVSTDKAADPVSVMGCSKRIAELLIQGSRNLTTTVIGVRFGNVLGSRGSVIPLFRRQIEQGGPVTVTSDEMVRYFMTITEAARLVLQAGAFGRNGEIFLLDMGNPVKIVDLARQMIKLSGFEPDADIEIKVTGLRPGEKLVESLTGKDEKLSRTQHPKIFKLYTNGSTRIVSDRDIEDFKRLAIDMDFDGIMKKFKDVVPNYLPYC